MDGFGQPGSMDRADPALLAFLAAHRGSERFPLATANALTAAPVIIATGWPVAALGGFIGQDPIVGNDQLAELVRDGQMRYFLMPDVAQLEDLARRLNGEASGAGREGLGSFLSFLISDNARWVTAHCTPVPPAEWRSPEDAANPLAALSVLYDCGAAQSP